MIAKVLSPNIASKNIMEGAINSFKAAITVVAPDQKTLHRQLTIAG